MTDDVLTHFHDRLDEARGHAATWLDRAEALRDLCVHADAVAGEHSQTFLTIDELWAAAVTEQDQARLRALVDRALPNEEE